MELTEIKIYPINQEQLKAYVTITLDNCFVIRDLKIIKGDRRLFVAMPNKKDKKGVFRDIVHPINADTRTQIEQAVLSRYYAIVAENPQEEETAPPEAPEAI
jgi:stage V sporulation protein G